jgi:nicotinamidase-related amidase
MSDPAVPNEARRNPAPGARSALLVVDMQVGLFDAEDMPFERERILANINLLIRSARVAGVPILAARHTGPIGSPLAPDSRATRLLDRLEIDPERDRVFTKTRPNCFLGKPLADDLVRFGTEELVIVDMKTQFCVDTTCRATAERGLKPVLVADAHTCTDTAALRACQIIEHHNATLQAFARVVRTADWRFV